MEQQLIFLRLLCTGFVVSTVAMLWVFERQRAINNGWKSNYFESRDQRDAVEERYKLLADLYATQSQSLRNARDEALDAVRERNFMHSKYEQSLVAVGKLQVEISELRRNNVRDNKGRYVKTDPTVIHGAFGRSSGEIGS